MQHWSDFERAQQAALKADLEKQLDSVDCKSCGSQWFEQVEVSQFQADHNLLVGQKVPKRPSTIPYILLRCVRCETMLIPRIIHQSRDIAAGTYDHFLDTMEEKGDTRTAKFELLEADIDKQLPPTVNLLGVSFNREQLEQLKVLLEKPAKKAPRKAKGKADEVPSKE